MHVHRILPGWQTCTYVLGASIHQGYSWCQLPQMAIVVVRHVLINLLLALVKQQVFYIWVCLLLLLLYCTAG